MARTQQQRKAETRARLLDAAADQFALRGFHGVSVEAVADAADRTTGALYDHFGSKEGLLFSLVEHWKTAAADAIVADVPDPGDLHGILGAAWDHITADPEGNWLLLEMELWLHGARDPEIGSALTERYRSIRSDLAAGLTAWASTANRELSGSVERLAALVLAMLLGAALQYRLDPAALDAGQVIRGVHALVASATTTTTTSEVLL